MPVTAMKCENNLAVILSITQGWQRNTAQTAAVTSHQVRQSAPVVVKATAAAGGQGHKLLQEGMASTIMLLPDIPHISHKLASMSQCASVCFTAAASNLCIVGFQLGHLQHPC